MRTVSIGYYREDGDFAVLATLNNNDEREVKDEGFDLVFHGRELKHYAGIGTTIFFHPLHEINLGALQ